LQTAWAIKIDVKCVGFWLPCSRRSAGWLCSCKRCFPMVSSMVQHAHCSQTALSCVAL